MKLPDWLNEARGRKSALAARLGVPASFIIKIAVGEKKVPLDHCPAIQEFTGGAVTCEELRPDMVEFFAMVRQQAGSREAKQPPALANAAQGAINSVAAGAAHHGFCRRPLKKPGHPDGLGGPAHGQPRPMIESLEKLKK